MGNGKEIIMMGARARVRAMADETELPVYCLSYYGVLYGVGTQHHSKARYLGTWVNPLLASRTRTEPEVGTEYEAQYKTADGPRAENCHV